MAADSVYGAGDIEMPLKRAAKGYVLGVNANHSFVHGTNRWPLPVAVHPMAPEARPRRPVAVGSLVVATGLAPPAGLI